MKFQNLSINNKLLVVFIPLGLLFSISIGYFYYYSSSQLILDITLQEEKKNSIILNNAIQDFQSKALTIAKIFANHSAVEPAYLNQNELEGSNYLLKSIKPQIDQLLRDEKISDFQIHYHKSPAQSFLRSWTGKRFDDLSSFRPTILHVSKTEKPLKAIEFGVGGFAIRGIAPIFIRGDYVGSVEFLYEMKDVLNLLTSDKSKSDVFSIVKTSVADAALNKEQIEKFYSLKVDNYYVSSTSSHWANPNNILDDELLTEMSNHNKSIIKNYNDVFFSLNPILDINDNKIGYVVFVKNNDDISKTQQTSIVSGILIVMSLIVFLILTMLILINNIVIKRVRLATKLANEISVGKFESFKKD